MPSGRFDPRSRSARFLQIWYYPQIYDLQLHLCQRLWERHFRFIQLTHQGDVTYTYREAQREFQPSSTSSAGSVVPRVYLDHRFCVYPQPTLPNFRIERFRDWIFFSHALGVRVKLWSENESIFLFTFSHLICFDQWSRGLLVSFLDSKLQLSQDFNFSMYVRMYVCIL